jgi:hypothetical protein
MDPIADKTIRKHIAYVRPHITDVDGTQVGRILYTMYAANRVPCKTSWEALVNARVLDDKWPNDGNVRAAPFHESFEVCVGAFAPSSWRWSRRNQSADYATWIASMDNVAPPQ